MSQRLFALLGYACFALTLFGCNSTGNRGGVSGKVTLDNAPLEKGTISFVPVEGTESPSAGSNIENGAYAIPVDKGPMAGKYRVEIRATRLSGKKIPGSSPLPPGTMVDEVVEAVPATYRGVNSTLRAEITTGTNTKDFELKSK